MTTPYTAERAPCYPSKHLPSCGHCSRRRCGFPPEPEQREVAVVDGAVHARNGICGLFALDVEPARMARAA